MSTHTCSYYCDRPECIRAQRDELRQALEQAEKQEPFAWIHYAPGYKMQVTQHSSEPSQKLPDYFKTIPVYTAPPRKEWTHLTDEEFDQVLKEFSHDPRAMAIELEIRIMEKNT